MQAGAGTGAGAECGQGVCRGPSLARCGVVVAGDPGWWQSWRWWWWLQCAAVSGRPTIHHQPSPAVTQTPAVSSPDMADREDKVYKAKLAEQAERYDGE